MDKASEPESEVEKIVVTGTFIKGIEPVGTNVVGMSSDDIIESGAMDTNQLLAQIPQITSAFNQVPTLPALDPGNSIVRPQLRNFGNTSGGSTTLVLVDGHRSVNAGVLITAPDPSVIPPGILERVDVVPDGGSSIYGSDAVAGVINFITKKRFDGTELTARYGSSDGYDATDINITTGTEWDDGGVYVSYSFFKNSALLGEELDWYKQSDESQGYCLPGTVFSEGTSYALPNLEPNTIAQCDNLDKTPFVPAQERHSVFSAFSQDLSASTTIDVKAYYSSKQTDLYQDMAISNISGEITNANPYYRPLNAMDTGTQTVRFSYGTQKRDHQLKQYGISAEVNSELNDDWEVVALMNYGRSKLELTTSTLDFAAQSNALSATNIDLALNPYDPLSTNPSVLASIFYDNEDVGQQTMKNGRVILNGSIYELEGGDAKVAFGAEFLNEKTEIQVGLDRETIAKKSPSRDVNSIFGEVILPIVSSQNAVSGIEMLQVSASLRWDDYSDWGSTSNAKLGLTYQPVDWLNIRANWGESFNAPSLADTTGAPDSRIMLFSSSPFVNENDDIDTNRPSAIIAGGNPDLQPQEAETWSVGFDITPLSLDDLKISLTYYEIEMTNAIGNMFAAVFIPLGVQSLFNPAYSNYTIIDPSRASTESLATNLPIINNGHGSIESFYNDQDGQPYAILDWRRQNLGKVSQNGIDFNVSYSFDTSMAEIAFNLGGSYLLGRDVSAAVGQTPVNETRSPGVSQLSTLANVNAVFEEFYLGATVRYSKGYDLNPDISGQSRVASFTTVDLFGSYELESLDATLSLNLLNILDREPPVYRAAQGFANGSTLGRLLQVGITKRF